MYSKIFEKSGAVMAVDFTNKRLIYPEEVTAELKQQRTFINLRILLYLNA